MKKKGEVQAEPDDMLTEYDFSAGVRGKYAAQYRAGSNVVVIDPDLTHLFPTTEAVNTALRKLAALEAARG